MPAVKKAKKSSSKKKPTSRSRSKSTRGSKTSVTNQLSQVWSGIVTYAVVALCIVTIAAVLMLAAGGYFANVGERFDNLSSRVAKSMGFSVTRVAVRGQDWVSDRDILSALEDPSEGALLGKSLLNLDAKDLRERVEQLSWVKSAAVQKLWPDTLHVTIIEREPVAMWQDEDFAFHLVDIQGTVLDQTDDGEVIGLPVISRTNQPQNAAPILEALVARPALKERVAAVISVNDRRFDLRFRNNFTAKLPEQDIETSLERLEKLGAGTGKLSESLQYLDLRNPDWAYFQLKQS